MTVARHNLVWYLNESGQASEAAEALARTLRIYLDLGDPMHLVRLRWLEGRIARNLGQFEKAEAALLDARDAFIAQGIGFDAARVALDLAAVYLRQRRTAEVKRLAAEMVPIFESRDVHQEALAALLVFREAAEAERVTASLVERLTTFLTRARRNPELRFDAEG